MGRGHFSILQQNIHYFKEVVIALSKILLNESHIILRGQSKKKRRLLSLISCSAIEQHTQTKFYVRLCLATFQRYSEAK